jgi:ubiquinone/menaquinone biosynthesis C-methylase UbiE
MHVSDEKVEAEILKLIGRTPFDGLLDLGTGTGRMLELLADRYRRAIGIDSSRTCWPSPALSSMRPGSPMPRCGRAISSTCRSIARALIVVTIHQVLHFLHDPLPAITEAARMLRPGGRVMLVDFAAHDHEELRLDHAHARLGFSHAQVADWLEQAA